MKALKNALTRIVCVLTNEEVKRKAQYNVFFTAYHSSELPVVQVIQSPVT
jgi:hypothetical protein